MIKPNKCCGCEMCCSICPTGAITMLPDAEGFLYPQINSAACTNCGLCETRCPVVYREKIAIPAHNAVAYSGYLKDPDKLRSSASGGIATAICEKALHDGGVVAGVVYDNGFKGAHYVCIQTTDELPPLRNSKYIQARKGGIYERVKGFLKQDRDVLFVGLPCEVAALLSFLGGHHARLKTCELICHGPTSPKVAQEFVDKYSEKVKIKAFSVRHIYTDWTKPYLKIDFVDGTHYVKPFYQTSYGKAFVEMLRPSCYHCSFKGDARVADLTIGDHWAVKKDSGEFNKNGVSIALVNTEKGAALLEDLPGFKLQETDVEAAVRGNQRIDTSTPMRNREAYVKDFLRYGLEKACWKHTTLKQKLSWYLVTPAKIWLKKGRPY